jgi:hypothetical protein
VATAILDGEAVVYDAEGRTDFGALQQSLGGRGGKRTSTEAVFVAFDLLYFDGHDVRGMELTSRRHLLEGLLADAPEGYSSPRRSKATAMPSSKQPASTVSKASSPRTETAPIDQAVSATGTRSSASSRRVSWSSATSGRHPRAVGSAAFSLPLGAATPRLRRIGRNRIQ